MIGAGKDAKNRLRGDELRKYSESKLWEDKEIGVDCVAQGPDGCGECTICQDDEAFKEDTK